MSLPERIGQTLRDTKRWTWTAAALFVIGLVVGFAFLAVLLPFLNRAKADFASHQPSGWWAETGRTFVHNGVLDYLAMRLGVVGGIVPGAHAVFNGMIAGTVFARIVASDRLGAVALMLPHAIFELPALFIAAGLGLWLGLKRRPANERNDTLRKANEVFLGVVLPLALVAAAVEETNFTDWRPCQLEP